MSSPGRLAGLATHGSATVLASPGPVTILVLAMIAVLVAACGGGTASNPWPTPVFVEAVTQAPMGNRETAYDPPRPAPALRLTDGNGKPFDLASLRGRPVFVYFGYTHCPDVCPTTLADLRAGIKEAGVDAKVVFVTIDPARDDAAAMKQYTDYYMAGYTGLTGTADEIARAAEAWGVTYQKLPSDSASGYAMAHSTDAYLVDAEGQLRHHIFFGAGPDVIADKLREVADQ
jgi:protein SCO1